MKSSDNAIVHSFLTKLRASFELMRPANIVTAFSDILAGFAASSGTVLFFNSQISAGPEGLSWLVLSTCGLYGGGIVMNDVLDAKLDAKERPERAIPSGRVSKAGASVLGVFLLLIGIAAATQVSQIAFILALSIGASALIYDYKAKHSVFYGPLFMGLCRSSNFLLGMSAVPLALTNLWPLLFISFFYIGSITLISQGEVHGGSKTVGYLALLIVVVITISLMSITILIPYYQFWHALPFAVLFGAAVIPAFVSAASKPSPDTIKKAVKRGVICLILLNSTLTAGFAGILTGAVVALLLPLSLLLSKIFAVT